jgi:hypothetical protein
VVVVGVELVGDGVAGQELHLEARAVAQDAVAAMTLAGWRSDSAIRSQ